MPSRKQKYRIGRKKQTRKGKKRTKRNKINNDSRSKQKNKTILQQKKKIRYNTPKPTYVQNYYKNKATYSHCNINTTTTMMTTIQIPRNKRTKPILARKLDYSAKLKSLLTKYDSFLLISITNIPNKQIDKLKKILRNKAQFLLGANTLSRKIIRDYIRHKTDKQTLFNLIYALKGQCGFIFTRSQHIDFVKKHVIACTKQYCPKAGSIAPQDVYIGPGPTDLNPYETSGFAAMNIPTRIYRGQIDIIEQVHLIEKGRKVSNSERLMLNKLNIKPFTHQIKIENVYRNGEWHTQHYLYAIKMNSVSIDHIAPSVYGYGFDMEQARISDLPNNLINAYQQINGLGLELRNYTWDSLEVIKNIMIKIAVSQYNDELKTGMLVVGYLRRNEKECCGKIIPTQLFAIFLQYYGIEEEKEEEEEEENYYCHHHHHQ
eukprot:28448_1